MVRFLVLFSMLCASVYAAETVKVGVNLSLSGGGVIGCEELLHAVQMKADALNARVDAPYRYEVVFEDNQTTVKGSAMAAQKLINIDKVDAMITVYDYAVGPTAPLAKHAKLASLGLGYGANLVDGQYNFLFGCSEVASGKRIADYLRQSPDVPTAIISARAPANGSLVDAIVESSQLEQDPPVFWYNPQDIDFRTLLLKVQATQPQHLVLVCYGVHFDKVMHQLAQMPDFSPELVGFGFAYRFAKEPQQVAGQPFVAPKPFPDDLADEFAESFGSAVTQEYVPFAYDSLGVIDAALTQHGDPALLLRQRIVEALRQTKTFAGATGEYTQDDHGVFDTAPNLYRLVDGVEVKL